MVSPKELTEEVCAPVRIAPVSSQLINAALSFGRNVRDPRIRQLSSRIESQLTTPTPLTVAPPLNKKPQTEPEQESKSKKPSPKKDRKANSQLKDNRYAKVTYDLSKVTEENIKQSRSSPRTSDKSPNKKSEKHSPKKFDGKNSKKSKVDDLFSTLKSPQRERPEQNSHLPSKALPKKDQMNLPDISLPKPADVEQISKIESVPKRTKPKDNNQGEISGAGGLNTAESLRQTQKLSIDIDKAQSFKETETIVGKVSPKPMDSAEMLSADMEKIVRNPVMISKTVKLPEIPMSFAEASPKSSDESLEDNFEDIIRNPTKQVKFDKIIRNDDLKTVAKPISLETTDNDKLKQSVIKVSNEINVSNDVPVPNVQMSHKQSFVVDNVLRSSVIETRSLKITPRFPFESPQQIALGHVKDPRLLVTPKEDENTPEIDKRKLADETLLKDPTSIKRLDLHTPNCKFENSNEQFDSTGSLMFNVESNSVVNDKNFNDLFDMRKPIEESTSKLPFESLQTTLLQHKSDFSNDKSSARSSPKRPHSPVVEPMDIIEESNENIPPPTEISLCKKQDKRQGSPVHEERKVRKGEKPSIAEQIIADAEKHEASPSPPPPSVISDKFKEMKQSSLSRLRFVGRPRENLEDSESPEPSDVDLRTQIQPPSLINDLKSKLYHIILVVLALQECFKYFVKLECIKHFKSVVVFLSTHLGLVIFQSPTIRVNEY